MQTSKQYIAQFDVSEQLSAAPVCHDAPPQFHEPGLKAVFYDSVDYQGKPTRCFAWIGLPKGASRREPVPGIVLVHGGGGTALANWVKHWNSLGYAAISMDTCGGTPCWSATPGYHPRWPRHDYSGASGWGGYEHVGEPLKEQWVYQATAAVLRGTALLRGLPEVDSDRIGIAGISWGGFLTLIASSIVPSGTYRFAIPVYACSHFAELSTSTVDRDKITASQLNQWVNLWDPAPALRGLATPTLFLTDAEDCAFALPLWQRTTELPLKKAVSRSCRIHYTHDHETSMHSKTEAAFASAILHGSPLPVWGAIHADDRKFYSTIEMNGRRAMECELCFTRAEGLWTDRCWRHIPATIHGRRVEAEKFKWSTAAFFTVTDDDGAKWSGPVFVLPGQKQQ